MRENVCEMGKNRAKQAHIEFMINLKFNSQKVLSRRNISFFKIRFRFHFQSQLSNNRKKCNLFESMDSILVT